MPQFGLHPCPDDNAFRAAIRGKSALECHIGALAQGGIGLCKHPLCLFNGKRFPCQGGFLRLKRKRLDEPDIRWDEVPRFQDDDIPGHEGLGGDRAYRTVAQDGGDGRRHFFQSVHRCFCPSLLDEAQHGIEQYDEQNDQRIGQVADEAGYQRGDKQDEHHEVGKLLQENL